MHRSQIIYRVNAPGNIDGVAVVYRSSGFKRPADDSELLTTSWPGPRSMFLLSPFLMR